MPDFTGFSGLNEVKDAFAFKIRLCWNWKNRLRPYQERCRPTFCFFNEIGGVTITDLGRHIIYAQMINSLKYRNTPEELWQDPPGSEQRSHPKGIFAEMWRPASPAANPGAKEIKNRERRRRVTLLGGYRDGSGEGWIWKAIPVFSPSPISSQTKEQQTKSAAYQQELIVKQSSWTMHRWWLKPAAWYITMPENTIQWSVETYRILKTAGSPMSFASFMEKCTPMTGKHWNSNGPIALKTQFPYEMEHRITPSGEKWVSERCQYWYRAGRKSFWMSERCRTSPKRKNEHTCSNRRWLYTAVFLTTALMLARADGCQYTF